MTRPGSGYIMKGFRMRRRRYFAALVAASAVVGSGLTVVSTATPALAVACNGSKNQDLQAFRWQDPNGANGPGDVKGIRAPIKIRKDGALCDDGILTHDLDTTWIAVEQTYPGAGIAQIGQYSWYDNGTHRDCLVWAIGTGGNPTPFDCGNLGDGSLQYFKIHPNGTHDKFVIEWCHSYGDYSDAHCDVQDNSQTIWASTEAAVSAEELLACGTHIFGIVSDQQTVGTAGNHVEAEASGLTFSDRTFTKLTDKYNCDTDNGGSYNYHQDNGGEIMHWYDIRNTGF